MNPDLFQVLTEAEWAPRAAAHERRVAAWTDPRLDRRSRGEKHPVEDFLWTYYSYPPSALRAWHPGLGVTLTGDVERFASIRGFVVSDGRAFVSPGVARDRADQVRGVRDLLVATRSRPPLLGCFGLHEWAMVYRQPADQVRHSAVPLRLGAAGTDAVVEGHRLTCSHYDAYRFFTAEATGRNAHRPTLATRVLHEQPGCLHAGMDVYKWAYKLAPLAPADLVADCFALAAEIRTLDMRASPYDLRAFGYQPVAIETAAGKAEYVRLQRAFAERAGVLRGRLIAVCEAAVGNGSATEGG